MNVRSGLSLLWLMTLPLVCCAATTGVPSQSTLADQAAIELTVYNSNIALVKDTRQVTLPTGEGELRFMDVASSINPVTVSARSLNFPTDFSILDQNLNLK